MSELGERYRALEPTLTRIADDLKQELARLCDALGIYSPRIDARVKAPQSFLLKVARREVDGRGYANPLQDVGDKVGARADLIYLADVSDLVGAIEKSNHFAKILQTQDKSLELRPKELGYSGVHVDVVPSELYGVPQELATCEIQVRTNAQAAWAMAQHQLVYKPPVKRSASEQRRVNRLTILLELFDEQVAQARQDLMTSEGFPLGLVLQALENARLSLVPGTHHPETTHRIVEAIARVPDIDAAKRLVAEIEEYVSTHEAKLRNLLSTEWPPLAQQPEAILIYQMLDTQKHELQARWIAADLPDSMLGEFADHAAVALPDL